MWNMMNYDRTWHDSDDMDDMTKWQWKFVLPDISFFFYSIRDVSNASSS